MPSPLFLTSQHQPASCSTRSFAYVKKADHPTFRSVTKETRHQLLRKLPTLVLEITQETWILDQKRWVLISPEGVGIEVTAKEMLFLETLANPCHNGPTTRQTLLQNLYRRDDYYASRALDSLVKRLRSKIAPGDSSQAPIKTAHNIGYFFSAELLLSSSALPTSPENI